MIPPVLHFIWVSLGEDMSDLFKLCILSAVLTTKCKVVVHTDDPSFTLPGVETRLREFPTTINGHAFDNTEELGHFSGKRVSHLKDVVRLQILQEEGGIYSDLDVLWLRHPWHLLTKTVVLGYQNNAYKTLCNAVMMAEPGHQAIQDYLEWTVSLYPPKHYWTPANPYKLWRDKPYREQLTYVDQHVFFGRRYTDEREYTFETTQRATAIHLYWSHQKNIVGEVWTSLVEAVQETWGLELKVTGR